MNGAGHGGPAGAQSPGAAVAEAGSSGRGPRPGHPGLQGPRREAERGEGVLTGPLSRRPAPLCARSGGDGGTLGARRMEMVWEKRAALGEGAPRGRCKQGPLPTTHTHLLGDQLGSLRRFQLPAGTRRARPRTYVHTYIYPYIRAFRHTSRTPAPTGAPSLAQNPLQRVQLNITDTLSVTVQSNRTQLCVIFGDRNTQTQSRSLKYECHGHSQMNTQNSLTHTYFFKEHTLT